MERGTEITLHLKDDMLEYTDAYRLRNLAQHYSEFVIYPISLRTTHTTEVEEEDDELDTTTKDEEKKDDEELEVSDEDDAAKDKPKKTKIVTSYEWERLNSNPAIWTRDKEEITDDEYQAFFHVSFS
jgi:heat shock protein beta